MKIREEQEEKTWSDIIKQVKKAFTYLDDGVSTSLLGERRYLVCSFDNMTELGYGIKAYHQRLISDGTDVKTSLLFDSNPKIKGDKIVFQEEILSTDCEALAAFFKKYNSYIQLIATEEYLKNIPIAI